VGHFGFLLGQGGQDAVLIVLQHSVGEFLAQLPAAVQLLVGEKEEGHDEAGDHSHLDVKRQRILGKGWGTWLPVEMMMAVMP